MKLALSLAALVCASAQITDLLYQANVNLDAPVNHQSFIKKINSMQKDWVAHESPRFAGANLSHVANLCGTVLKDSPNYFALPEIIDDTLMESDIPESFDARDQWPACPSIAHVRDQSSCGSCWAFGSTEAYNDRRCIATGDATLLSVEDTTACCGLFNCMSQGCGGGQPSGAWNWFSHTGVVSGGDFGEKDDQTCLPYSMETCAHHVPASSGIPECPKTEYKTPRCKKSCVSGFSAGYSSDKRKADSAYSLSTVAKIQSDIMKYGPVTGAFSVYSDFPTYKEGVYKHVSGSMLGGHAIKIYGWGVESGTPYWLVMNSWNSAWGDKGSFKILRGSDECGIESQISAGRVSK